MTAAALVALVLPAAASASVVIRGVDPWGLPKIRATVVTSTPSAVPPSLTENGVPASAFRAENLGRHRSIVLAIDRSRSMAGPSLRDAIAAARQFVRTKRPADRVAIVVFGSRAVQLTSFSSSPSDSEGPLRTLTVDPHQGTALYDAIELSAEALSGEQNPGRVILLVTDGRDVSSAATLGAAVDNARQAGAVVYPIGIAGRQFTPAALRAVARRTGGIYRGAASTGALSSIYASISRELGRSWRLEYLTAGRPGDKIAIRVTVPGEGSATRTVVLPRGAGSDGGSLLPAFFYTRHGTLALGGIIGFLVLLGVSFVLASLREGQLRGRLAPHLGGRKITVKRKTGRERLAALAGLFRATERAFANTRPWRSIARLLERADLPLRTVEFVYLMLGIGLGCALFTSMAGGGGFSVFLLFLIGAALPYGFLRFKAHRRRTAFENQLPDLLISLAASLKAGHGFKSAVQAMVDEGFEPAGKELKRVLAETRMGRPMEAALEEMAERVGSKNFSFIVTAVNIQTQVGGSLAGLFDMVADTVRQRHQFARKIKALTAMGRMSAYVLIGLPLFVVVALGALRPTYMAPLLHTSTGHTMLIFTAVLMTLGSAMLKKIVSFRG